MLRDNLRLAVHNILHRRLRSWLTILGIVVGVAAVVALISIGDGMKKAVREQFETVGYNTILLFPGAEGTTDGKIGAMRGMFGGRRGRRSLTWTFSGRFPRS